MPPSDRGCGLQDRNDSRKVGADARIRRLLGMPAGEEQRLAWTELHDALTSMRAHGQRIPEALTPDTLDLIDSLVQPSNLACQLN